MSPGLGGPSLSHRATLPPLDRCLLCWKFRDEEGCPGGSRDLMFQQVEESSSLSPPRQWFGTSCLIPFAFASSYEGTGRSLSLKLIQQLRQQSAQSQVSTTAENKTTTTARLASGTPEPDLGPAVHSKALQTCRSSLPL